MTFILGRRGGKKMLTEYIIEYAKARKAGEKVIMRKIERDLEKLGMDNITLNALADDVDNGYIKEPSEK